MIKYGIEFFFAYKIPLASILLEITRLILTGKFWLLELLIRDFKFEPYPEIKIQAFFLPFYRII